MQPISTNNLYNETINNALSVQTNLATIQVQESSGLQADNFGALGGSSSREMLNLENDISRAQNWAGVAKTVGSTTQAMYSAVGNMNAVVTKLQQVISQAMSSPNNSDLLNLAQGLQASLLTQVNEQVGGNYVFAGSNTSMPPVSTANYPTLSASTNAYDPTTPDSAYYKGDRTILSVQVNLQQTVTYGVNADNSAIEQAMRAVQSVISAAEVTSNSTLTGTSSSAPTSASGGILTVNGTNFTITAGQSLDQIAASINTQAHGNGINAKVLLDSSGAYHLQLNNGMSAMSITDASGLGLSSADPLPQAQLTSALQQSLTLSNTANVNLGNLQQTISNNSEALSNASTAQTTFVTYLQNSLSSVKDVDSSQAAAQAQQYQAQLQASYMAVASLSKMTLAQYL